MTKKVVVPKKVKDVVTFKTSTGKTVVLKSIPQLLIDRIQASVDRPEPPKYKIEAAGGDIIWEPYNNDNIIDASEEDKLLYNRYLRLKAEAEAKLNENMFKVVVMRGIEIDLPEDDSWIEMQRFLGVKIPDDPLELKYLYVQTEVIGNTDDLMSLTSMVMEMTGVPEDALAEARKSFPGFISGKETPEDEGTGERQVES